MINFGIFGKVYVVREGFDKLDKIMKFFMRYLILGEGFMFGGILFIVGLILGIRIFLKWRVLGYGELFEIRLVIIVLILIVMSI